MDHKPQRLRGAEILFWILCVSASLRPGAAYAQYEAPPFDSIHLGVPEISQARDWYLKIGGSYRVSRLDLLASANVNAVNGEPYARTVLLSGGRTITSIVLPVEPIGANLTALWHDLSLRWRQEPVGMAGLSRNLLQTGFGPVPIRK